MTAGGDARNGSIIRVRVQPRASRDEIVGWREPGVLAVRVTAPPVEGDANRAVEHLLARELGVRPSAVTVIRGQRSRDKLVRVASVSSEAIDRLAPAAGPGAQGVRR